MSRVREDQGLGRTQRLVLQLLASREAGGSKAPAPSDLAYDWPGLTESAARSALMRLGDRGLVDLAGVTDTGPMTRTYCLTKRGAEVERGIVDEVEEWGT